MFTDAEISQIKKLNSKELAEFCDYWSSTIIKPGKAVKRRVKKLVKSDGIIGRTLLKARRGSEDDAPATDKETADQTATDQGTAENAEIPVTFAPDISEKNYRKRELSDGWYILDSRHADRCSIFDSANILRAQGNTRNIASLLVNEARSKDICKKIESKEWGLVLAGGGAKGAFEIGVWKWLKENGISSKITGVSGTSVGALNSALFAQCSYEEAEELWKGITQQDLTYLDEVRLQEIAESLSTLIGGLASSSLPPILIAESIMRLSGPVFTQEKLEEIAGNVLRCGLSDRCAVYACTARSSTQDQKSAKAKEKWQRFFNTDYYCLNGLRPEEQVNIVLASAALPFVYSPHEIGGMTYYDGGCRDSVPVYPLVRAGFKKIIVVHLRNKKIGEPEVEWIGDSELFHVYPALQTAGFMRMIRITPKQTAQWIEDGYQSAAEQLGKHFRNKTMAAPFTLKKRDEQLNKFNFEDFDYEQQFAKVQSEVVKPNILVCGATGVGKSSLIKDIFDLDESGAPAIGNAGKAKTVSVHRYSPKGATITLYDSAGYVFGEKIQNYKRDILGTIDDRLKKNPEDMNDHIHEVWYCVSVANKRFYEADKELIAEIIEKYHIPVMVVLTKIDLADDQDIADMRQVIREFKDELPVFTYSVAPALKELDEEIYRKYVQKDEIIAWAMDNLTDALRMGFVPALKGALKAKRDYVISKEIPKYAGLAGAVVLATSFVNVPFTDSVPLMTLQVKMAYSILNDYGIKMEVQKTLTDIVGTSFVTYIGRTLASQLISVIPIAGNAVKATVNTSVAAGVTAVLGAALAVICEQYLSMCVDANGAENLPFANFLTTERLKEAIEYVNGHKGEFNIDEIISSVTNKKNE